MCCCYLDAQSCLTLCNPMESSPPGSSVYGVSQARLAEWVACHALLQGIFLTQGSNPRLLHWQVDSLPLSHQGSPGRSAAPHVPHTSLSLSFLPFLSLSHVSSFPCDSSSHPRPSISHLDSSGVYPDPQLQRPHPSDSPTSDLSKPLLLDLLGLRPRMKLR